jgi:DNA-binding GntR family transcriptional regulator
MLAEMYRQLRAQIDRHRLRSLELRGNIRRSIAEHKAILRAVRAGDVERAVHLVSEHIRVPQIRLQAEEQGVEAAS